MTQDRTRNGWPPVQPAFSDYLSLWLLKLAKMRRRNLVRAEGEECAGFYAEFFEEKDVVAYTRDVRMIVRRDTVNSWLKSNVSVPANILDVGCGLGDILMELPEGYDLFGMDYAERNVAMLKRRLQNRAEIRHGDIYEIPFGSNSMDACICLEVLEHVEDDARGLRELVRVLKPGGVLIASGPYQHYWPEYLKLMGHFRHYKRDSFVALLKSNGLTIETYLPNYPNWHQTYSRRYALVRAQFLIFGRLFGCREMYEFKWPWQDQPELTTLAARLDHLRRSDMELDYSYEATSTFVVARKPSQH